MAIVAGTALRYTSIGERESLSDVIYDISPEDVPFMSAIGRGPACAQTLEEWQTDALGAVDLANAHLEGDEATFATPAETVRIGNYTQISRKTLIISGTREATRKAGRKSDRAYMMAQKASELKRDMESILLSNQAAVAGSSVVARKLASLAAFVKTNVSKGVGGVDPVYTSGVPLAARTDGTQRAFTETILKNIIQLAWSQGGSPRILSVGPFNKTVVSGFAGIATRTVDVTKAQPTMITAAADVYVSDFGTIRVTPNRFQRERDAWLLDPSLCSLRYLRPFGTSKLAKTGDADKEMLLGEYTLQVNQEKGLALAADLLTS